MGSERDAESGAWRYRVPAGTAQAELIVKNSTFVGTVGPAPDSAAAHAFVEDVRARYADADHHAWAYRICGGPQGEIGSSDDGEPGGTAGRPMLAILEGSGLREVVVVGTRYFGGIKLGAGGLVRAYAAAAREVLQRLPTEERILHIIAAMTIDYALYGNLRYVFPQRGVRIEEEAFAERVSLRVAVPAEGFVEVAGLLSDLTNGAVRLAESIVGRRYYAAHEAPATTS